MPNRPHLFQRFNSDHQLLKSSPKSPAKKQQPAKVAPKSASNNQILANLFGATSFTTSSSGKKMRHVEMIMEDQQLETGGSGQQQTQQQQQQQESTLQTSMKRPKSGPAKKWASAFRVVHAMTRFKNMPKRHHHEGLGGSRGSSFSGSNESTPTRGTHQQDQEPEIIDPVYLALKQATAKYGNSAGNGSRSGSRRGSQVALAGHGHLFDADTTPSPRNLSQTSLQDSGYSGGCVEIDGSRSRLVSGSTPHLHRAGVGLANGKTTTTSAGGGGGGATTSSQQPAGTATNTGSGQQQQQSGGGRRPKLSEKMKSLSLDCAEMPAPVQPSLGRNQYYKSKPIRSARGFATSGESFEDALERSVSPPASARTVSMAAAIPPMVQPRRLPPAPTPQQQPQTAAQQPTGAAAAVAPPSAAASTMPVGTHIVIHEYIYGDCTLYLGDRLVVVDNGDPDWKHGFKVNDRLEQLYTFPSTCVSGFQPNEQPMKLIQNCNLTEQKLRLYRDQVIFVQPNSLREDGRVLIRNEHGTFAYCPLHFLQLM